MTQACEFEVGMSAQRIRSAAPASEYSRTRQEGVARGDEIRK